MSLLYYSHRGYIVKSVRNYGRGPYSNVGKYSASVYGESDEPIRTFHGNRKYSVENKAERYIDKMRKESVV